MITEHAICALPASHRDWRHFAIKVQRRGNSNDWVLNWGGLYYAGDGDWLASIGDAFEYAEVDALWMAEVLAPQLEVSGITVAEALERGTR